jgi:hypothetical protein
MKSDELLILASNSCCLDIFLIPKSIPLDISQGDGVAD